MGAVSRAENVQTTGIIVIPARFASSRLSRKLLLDRSGRPLLSYAVERAKETLRLFPDMFLEVYVAADDERLCRIAEEYGAKSILTQVCHPNGTSRIAEAVRLLKEDWDGDFVVNLQGDHPRVTPEAILQVGMALIENPSADMSTAAVQIDMTDDKSSACRDVVKVSFDEAARATAFSRTSLIQNLQNKPISRLSYRHVGLYVYRTTFLEAYANLSPSPGELREDLEQLRALEHQADIRVVTIPSEMAGPGIDTEEDYETFVRSIRSRSEDRISG